MAVSGFHTQLCAPFGNVCRLMIVLRHQRHVFMTLWGTQMIAKTLTQNAVQGIARNESEDENLQYLVYVTFKMCFEYIRSRTDILS